LCYAKIEPAALQRGEIADRNGVHAQAAGHHPKSGFSKFPSNTDGVQRRSRTRVLWHQVEQIVPDA
jgi:hypothetical protein